MDRDKVSELHYITPIANLPSILDRGILSHARAEAVGHVSVAGDRNPGPAPGGGSSSGGLAAGLHEYVNLYFHARNPMMAKRRDWHEELCVLRVNSDVLDSPGTIVTSQNASSDYAAFRAAP